METYNYYEQVKEDVKEYIRENYESVNQDDWNDIHDDCFNNDCVTGNASGSYTFNTYEAEENLTHNQHLLVEAAEEFEYRGIPFEWIENAETADVVIRCYILGKVITEAIDEVIEEREN